MVNEAPPQPSERAWDLYARLQGSADPWGFVSTSQALALSLELEEEFGQAYDEIDQLQAAGLIYPHDGGWALLATL